MTDSRDLPYGRAVQQEARRRKEQTGIKYTQALREVRALLGMDPQTGLLLDTDHSHLYREYGEPEMILGEDYQRYRCIACGDNTRLVLVSEL